MTCPNRSRRPHAKLTTAVLIIAAFGSASAAAAPCVPARIAANPEQIRHRVDPAKPLLGRVAPASTDAIAAYVQSGVASAKPHPLSRLQTAAVGRAIAQLPPAHRRVLQAHLRHLSFVDVPPGAGNGLTAIVNDGEFPIFDLTLRAGILDETLSDFLTAKERSAFADDGSGATVTIESPGSALPYVLLHEASHVLDRAIGATGGPMPPLANGNWLDRTRLAPRWAGTPIAFNAFRRGPAVPIASAAALYRALSQSPFPTLYATAAAPEDFAELIAWGEMSRRWRRPLVITVRDRTGAPVETFEPLRKPQIARRLAEAARLLDKCPASTPMGS